MGDFYRPDTLEAALQGVQRMFLVDFETDQVTHALAAAKSTGVRHIVELSTIEAGHEPLIGHGIHHRQSEERVPPVDPYDVAAVAAAVLNNSAHEHQAYTLTGPELLTFGDMAGVLSRAFRYLDVPEAVAAEGMRQGSLPE